MDTKNDSTPPPEQTSTEASPPDGLATRSVAVCAPRSVTDLSKAEVVGIERSMKPRMIAAALYCFFGRAICKRVITELAVLSGVESLATKRERRTRRRKSDPIFGELL